MGRTSKARHMSGLVKVGGIWHIDKQVRGRRICESTGTSDLREAEAHLVHRLETLRQVNVYGSRRPRSFREAATKYLNETVKRSLDRDAQDLRVVDPYIGHLALEHVHMDTLRDFVQARRQAGSSRPP